MALSLAALSLLGCTKKTDLSRQKARAHVEELVATAKADVEEVRVGLPQGAQQLEAFFGSEGPGDDAAAAKSALSSARGKVPALRAAKSTFFLLAAPDGRILRSDQEHDALSSKNLFSGFTGLKPVAAGEKYVETRGSMAEAAGVRGRGDGQWVAAAPVMKDGQVRGVLATGWSWSAYAYRLEFKLRSEVKSEERVPLVYVYVVVDKAAYGAPVAPDVIAKALTDADLLGKAAGETTVDTAQEIEGREFGIAVKRAPALGENVGIAVVRSET